MAGFGVCEVTIVAVGLVVNWQLAQGSKLPWSEPVAVQVSVEVTAMWMSTLAACAAAMKAGRAFCAMFWSWVRSSSLSMTHNRSTCGCEIVTV